jgi:hypothetical protein
LFHAPKLLEYTALRATTLLQLKELMLFSPLLQKVNFPELNNIEGRFGNQEHAEKERKKTEIDYK